MKPERQIIVDDIPWQKPDELSMLFERVRNAHDYVSQKERERAKKTEDMAMLATVFFAVTVLIVMFIYM